MSDMYMGWDDDAIAGDDDAVYEVGADGVLYEVGRRRGRSRRRERRAMRRAPEQLEVKKLNPPMRHTLDPSNRRVQPLGFTPIIIAAGGTGVATVNVQREFQGERLILTAIDTVTGLDVTFALQLTQFLVGSVNQLPSGAPQPCIAYTATAIATSIMMTPATVGTIIQLGFTSGAANIVSVSGVFFGTTRGEA